MTDRDTRRQNGSPAAGRGRYDLVFVGAGASTSFVLMSLLSEAVAQAPSRPLRIGVVDSGPEPFTGLPYGSRTARSCLLITSLRDFLPEGERRLFAGWLSEQKTVAFDEYLQAGGPHSARWWERHRDQIERDEFDDLFLPRYLFGDYLAERVHRAIEAGRAAGAAVVDVFQDEVLSLEPVDGDHRLVCSGRELTAHTVVLAIGSSPVRSRISEDDVPGSTVVVDDPFAHMGRALERIKDGLQQAGGDRTPVVLIIGANASAMDLLYQMNDVLSTDAEQATFVLLSPRGELPERIDPTRAGSSFVAENLAELAKAHTATGAEVYAAAVADISRGRAAGLTVADTLRPVSDGVISILPGLSPGELAQFAGRWGAELGRHQRRAGGEYCDVVEQLEAEGRLRLVAGSYLGLRSSGPGPATIRYQHDGAVHELPERVDVVINCGGPARDVRDTRTFLPARLISDGICAATPLGGGIAVDSSLAAAPGVYVMGPLLAGNVVDGVPVWHMEHCGRISASGSMLGLRLARQLLGQDTEPLPDVLTADDVLTTGADHARQVVDEGCAP